MKGVVTAFSCEALKVWRSKIFWISLIAFLFIPFIGGFFMFILKDPEAARSYGLIAAKAQLFGTADWPSYFDLLAQSVSVGGLVLFGFLTSWLFGREYSDRTVKDLLALPISRIHIVMGKFLLLFLWCLMLVVLTLVVGLWVGDLVVIPGWSLDLASMGIRMFLLASLLTIALCTPVAFFASIGRGYLSPIGFVILTIILAQIVAATGYGQYFPWAIPALYSRVVSSAIAPPGSISWVLVLITSLVGLAATSLWWRYADHD